MESFKAATNKFLGGEMFQNVFNFLLRIQLHDKTTWFCEANRIMVTDAINIRVTSSRPSSAGVTAAERGVAHSTILHQLTVFLTSHIQMVTI